MRDPDNSKTKNDFNFGVDDALLPELDIYLAHLQLLGDIYTHLFSIGSCLS